MSTRVLNNGKSEGGEVLASLVEKGTAITTGSLVKGTWYYVKAIAPTSSIIPANLTVGLPFQAPSALTLAEGDEVYPLTFKPIGFARDKSMDDSKNVIDTTTDADYPFSSHVLEAAITKTGSISGYMMVDEDDSALMQFLAQFDNFVSSDGTDITVSAPSNPIFILALDLNAKSYGVNGPSEGDLRHINFIPCDLTKKSVSASKGSTVTLSFDYQGQAKDNDGMKSAEYKGPHYAAE